MKGMVWALALTFVLPAFAWRDTIKPTTPKNFRVTAVTPFSVSLAWSASTDNSGKFTYRLWSSAGLTGGHHTDVAENDYESHLDPGHSSVDFLYIPVARRG